MWSGMSNDTRPDWLKNWKPQPNKKSERYTPLPKPTTALKIALPASTVRPAQMSKEIRQMMWDDAQSIMAVMKDKALEGDSAAAAVVLNRIIPTLKPEIGKVAFVLDVTAPIGRQVEQVLAAIAKADLSPDTGKKVIESIEVLSKIRTAEDLDKRLSILEGKVL